MSYTKLRIAWSVGWGLLAVLLCVLWVRSYWWMDRVQIAGNPTAHRFHSTTGRLTYELIDGEYSYDEWLTGTPQPDIEYDHLVLLDSVGWFGVDSEAPTRAVSAGFMAGKSVVDDYAIMAPHWFASLVVSSLAAVPWLPYRFSLRTLLLAITLGSILLGLVVWSLR